MQRPCGGATLDGRAISAFLLSLVALEGCATPAVTPSMSEMADSDAPPPAQTDATSTPRVVDAAPPSSVADAPPAQTADAIPPGDVMAERPASADSTPARLLVLIDGETGRFQSPATPHDGALQKGCKVPGSFTVATTHVRHSGNYGLRNQLERNNLAPCVASNTKAVISSTIRNDLADFERDTEYWLGFAAYLPPDAASTGAADAWHILYWHPNTATLTAIALDLGQDFRFKVTARAFGGPGPSSGWFGTGARGKWNEIVINLILSTDKGQGRFRVWYKTHDEAAFREVFTYSGITMNPTLEGAFTPFLMLGLLHIGGWKDAEAARTIYFDEIRLAKGANAMDLVKPGSGSTP